MSIGMKILTECSNKSIHIKQVTDGSMSPSQFSNEHFYMSNTTQILYIENTPNQLSYLNFLSLTNTIFEGVYGWIWVIIIFFLLFYLLKGVKDNVK